MGLQPARAGRAHGEVREGRGPRGLAQIVWSPLAQGVLTGKYAAGQSHAQRAPFLSGFLAPESLARVAKLVALSRELGRTPAQVALAFCLRRAEVASVITGATKVAQLEENAAASGLELAPPVARRLELIFPV